MIYLIHDTEKYHVIQNNNIHTLNYYTANYKWLLVKQTIVKQTLVKQTLFKYSLIINLTALINKSSSKKNLTIITKTLIEPKLLLKLLAKLNYN